MAAPSKKATAERADALNDEEAFLAVVIADSYDRNLDPCCINRPRILAPVANTPVIDYTLGFLSIAGIQEVILYCSTYVKEIKQYISDSGWSNVFDGFKIVSNEEAQSVGDALRDLDDKQMISTDFVLVHGDLVANLDLKQCMEVHKKTRETDKDAILTKVMKRCPPGHKIREPDNMSLYALHKSTNQLLAHRKVGGASKVKLPLDLLLQYKDLRLRYDLLDCHVTMCAAQIPSLLTDNFDYQTLDNLVQGVLGNQEIYGNTMHVHVVEEGYAARVSTLHSYHRVTQEVVDRWASPFTPDNNWSASNTNDTPPEFAFRNRYVKDRQKISSKCTVGDNVMIGKGTSIDDNSVITSSVIGKDCSIGANVRIIDSIIWDGTRIDNDCIVYNSIICDRVILHPKTRLRSSTGNRRSHGLNVVLGKQVELGPDIEINEEVKLVSSPTQDDWGESSPAYEGGRVKSKAYLYIPPSESDVEEEESEEISASGSESDSDFRPDIELFYDELMEMLKRVTAESIQAENIILDINSLKHAYNIQINEVNHMVIQAVMDYPVKLENVTTSQQLLAKLKPLLRMFLPVFKNYYRSEASQLQCLEAIEEFCGEESRSIFIPLLPQILKYFYDSDVLDEEVISSWYDSLDHGTNFRLEVKKLIDWFEEAEEDDSDSD